MNDINNDEIEMKFYIYKIYQKDDPTIFYIGSTNNINRRKSQHYKAIKNRSSKKYKYPLYKYIRALGGFDNFNIVIVHECKIKSKGEGLQLEQQMIDDLKPKLNTIRAKKTSK